MKKLLALSLPLLLAASAVGQLCPYRVAVLDVVNKDKRLPYGVKLEIRQNMVYALTFNGGYEAYDRVDMSQIMDEHKFQQSGMVSESQIKALGEMTGAQYILVTEAAQYDKENIILLAKLLNVETAGILGSSRPVTTSLDNIQGACRDITGSMLGDQSKRMDIPLCRALIFISGGDLDAHHCEACWSAHARTCLFPGGYILFGDGQQWYEPESESILRKVAQYTAEHQNELIIQAYGDGPISPSSSNTYAQNSKLGRLRGEAVQQALIRMGVDESRIRIVSAPTAEWRY